MFIPVLSLMSSLLLIKTKKNFLLSNIFIFGYSFLILLYAELIIRYTGLSNIANLLFIISPFIFFRVSLTIILNLNFQLKLRIMNSILFRYLLVGYFKTLLKVVLFFYCFGIIFNLFEEIEFFKNLNTSILTPLLLTFLFIPGMLIQLFPFIVFVTSLKFFLDIRNNRDLISMKIFGFSNFKIFLILAFTSFILGWFLLFFINPMTSVMSKYYEKTKSYYSKDIDHLVSFNKNGMWIKENLKEGQRIISAKNHEDEIIKDVSIFNFDKEFNLVEKIFQKVQILKIINGN